ncbi:hypothetical protein ACSBR1_030119 [Camellia fascicularis]
MKYIELAYTLNVNEKCDVYCYGVLALKVLVGKHPSDLLSTLSSSSASSSSSSSSQSLPTVHQILLKDVLDKRPPPPKRQVSEELVSIARLAIACLHTNPQSRPTMRQVSVELSTKRQPLLDSFNLITLGQVSDL